MNSDSWTLKKAYFGDENTIQDITRLIRDRIDGSTIDLPVDNQLVPIFEGSPEANLSDSDRIKIQQMAVEQCGAADQTCIEARSQTYAQQALQLKLESAGNPSNIVKGTRLRVELENTYDKSLKRVVIPAGQRFAFDKFEPESDLDLFSLEYIRRRVVDFSYYALIAFIWAFGIVATFVYFRRQDRTELAIGGAILAALYPGTGYIVILVAAGIEAFLRYYMGTQ
jgi:hypothetical protein